MRDLNDDALDDLGEAIGDEARRLYAERVNPTLAEQISATVHGRAIIVRTESAAVAAIEKGQRSRVMYDMVGRTVPIRTKTGATIFRKVTIEAIARGKWHRKSIPGKRLVEKAAQMHHLRSGLREPVTVQTIM